MYYASAYSKSLLKNLPVHEKNNYKYNFGTSTSIGIISKPKEWLIIGLFAGAQKRTQE